MELLGVLIGGIVGVSGTLGGIWLTEIMQVRREARQRKYEGLKNLYNIVDERSTLSLNIVQQINRAFGGDEDLEKSARELIGSEIWRSTVLELTGRPWLFDCRVYAPNCEEDFVTLDHLVYEVWFAYEALYQEDKKDREDKTGDAVKALRQHVELLHSKLDSHLTQLTTP